MKKIYINPKVPEWMDFKDINDRSKSHMDKWWCRPYIITQDFMHDTYEDYCERIAYTQEDDYVGDYKIETELEFNTRRIEENKRWHDDWGDDGIRYDVRILDGGAWDRTSNKGSYRTLKEAMDVCKSLLI